MKKIFGALLAVAMLCVAFAGCEKDTPISTNSGTDVSVTESEDGLGIPLTADFGNVEFRILSAGNQACNDFDFQEESSVSLDNAQYKRKLKVEEDYKVKIFEDVEKGYSSASSGSPGPGYTKINTAVNSGTADYDLCLIAGYDVSQLAQVGYLYDMNSIEGVDLTKSWWDQNATESLGINDVVFFTTGDITVSDNRSAFCIMFNKNLADEYGIESPYELVENNEWTFEKFAELCKVVSEDLNQDGVYDGNDRYGLLVWDDSIIGAVHAAGQRLCTINDDGKIELTFYNETTLKALELYTALAYDKEHSLTYQRYKLSAVNLWPNDQGLFSTQLIDNMPKFREMESDFGILPYPKLTESQDNYYTTIAPYNSQFICVPSIVNDIKITGTITEALAYYGQKIVTPAFYDVTLIGQSARDNDSEEMLDIIFDNLVYDIGCYYQIGTYNKQLILRLQSFDSNFTSMYDTYKSAAESSLVNINKFYTEAVAKWK